MGAARSLVRAPIPAVCRPRAEPQRPPQDVRLSLDALRVWGPRWSPESVQQRWGRALGSWGNGRGLLGGFRPAPFQVVLGDPGAYLGPESVTHKQVPPGEQSRRLLSGMLCLWDALALTGRRSGAPLSICPAFRCP